VSFAPQQAGARTAYLVIGSDAVSSPDSLFLTGKGIDLALKLTHIEPSAGSDLPVVIPVPDDYKPTVGRLYYRLTGQPDFQVANLVVSDSVLTASIPADFITLRGVEYYLYVSDGRNDGFYPEINPMSDPAAIRVRVERQTSPVELQKMVYKMISLPLQPEEPSVRALLFDDFGEYNKQVWRISRYNTPVRTYAEFPAFADEMTAGFGFWIISRQNVRFDVENSWSTEADGPFGLRLDPGWTQMGNPFAFPVRWSEINGSALVEAPVAYDGRDYRYDVEVIQPWEGYFVHNPGDSAVILSVPPIEAGDRVARTDPLVCGDGEYRLQLSASVPETKLVDGWNYLGLLKGAESGTDPKDFFEAPPIGDFVRLSIVENGERFAGNFKSPFSEGNRWEMEVGSTLPGNVDVKVRLSDAGQLGDSTRFYVLDRDCGRLVTSEVRSFAVRLDDRYPVRHFSVLIGSENYARKYSEGIPLVPLSFALEQNFPNPFNPETTVRYQLPAACRVELEIYNILGRKIRSLVSREEEAGEKSVVWDGRDDFGRIVAGGVYMTRLRAGGFTATKKMILLR
jgi:hypothetical protein